MFDFVDRIKPRLFKIPIERVEDFTGGEYAHFKAKVYTFLPEDEIRIGDPVIEEETINKFAEMAGSLFIREYLLKNMVTDVAFLERVIEERAHKKGSRLVEAATVRLRHLSS